MSDIGGQSHGPSGIILYTSIISGYVSQICLDKIPL